MLLATLLLLAYLLGAIPFGLLLTGAWVKQDVRRIGSGNIGATNVARAAGRGAGLVVLTLDAAKGYVPTVLAGRVLAPGPGQAWGVAAIAFAAFLGHCFPIYLRFRGGKGVATALGACLGLVPLAAAAGAVVWIAVFATTRISSVGSLSATVAAAIVSFRVTPAPAYAWLALVMGLFVFIRHRENIRRLLANEEAQL